MSEYRERRNVRMLIIGNHTSLNKGWSAIVISTVHSIRSLMPNTTFFLESLTPDIDAKVYAKYHIKVVGSMLKSPVKASFLLLNCLTRKLLGFNTWNCRELRVFRESDVVLDLSGDGLSRPFVIKGIRFRLLKNFVSFIGLTYLYLYALCFGRPLVLYARSLGPFGIFKPILKAIIDRASLVTVREELSYAYLRSVGIKSPIYVTADPAFILSSTNKDAREMLADKRLLRVYKYIIGFALSSEAAKFYYPFGEQEFIKAVAMVIDLILERHDAFVILIPHSIGRRKFFEDDRTLLKKVYKTLENKERVLLIQNDYEPSELKKIIALCDIFIGMRMHANILALSSLIPTLAIAHSHKYHGIMKMLGQEKWVCDVGELTTSNLISKVDEFVRDKDLIKKQLRLRVLNVKKLSIHNAELVRQLVEKLNLKR